MRNRHAANEVGSFGFKAEQAAGRRRQLLQLPGALHCVPCCEVDEQCVLWLLQSAGQQSSPPLQCMVHGSQEFPLRAAQGTGTQHRHLGRQRHPVPILPSLNSTTACRRHHHRHHRHHHAPGALQECSLSRAGASSPLPQLQRGPRPQAASASVACTQQLAAPGGGGSQQQGIRAGASRLLGAPPNG